MKSFILCAYQTFVAGGWPLFTSLSLYFSYLNV